MKQNWNVRHVSHLTIINTISAYVIIIMEILASTQSPIALSFVCLFVCLSVTSSKQVTVFLYIFTKLNPSMHLCRLTMPIVFLGQRSNN